ncbi:thioredoxin family protein [Microcoleus sp. N9_B4]|uniref:thioredoxin family protein n=1 Tax=Microcoleus sp. N9_B4 TaxID=3055386 RepID=UPI002FD5DE5F
MSANEALAVKANLEQAERYGVKAVPAIAVDGVVVFTGKPSYKQLQEVWFGQPTISLPSSIYLYAGMGISCCAFK